MICYRDKTFCNSPNCTCGKKLTEEDWVAAKELELPIAYAYFCGFDEITEKMEKMMTVCNYEEMQVMCESKEAFIGREQRLALSDALSSLLKFENCSMFGSQYVTPGETQQVIQSVIDLYNNAYPDDESGDI